MNKHLLAALIAAAFSLPAQAAAPTYTLQRLPSLPGSSGVPLVEGLNNHGAVVGRSEAGGHTVATLWAPNAAPLDLGSLPGQPQWAVAYGINDAGTVVGDARFGDFDSHAFRWTAGGGLQDLGGSRSSGIDNAGVAVGSARGANNRLEAGLWQTDGSFTSLGHLAKPGSTAVMSVGWGQSDSGFVLGATYYDNAAQIHWRWSPATGAKTKLNDLAGGAANYAAHEVNDSGWAVGESYTDNNSNAVRAVLWNPAGQPLALQGNGFSYSAAQDINNAGVVVGRGQKPGGGYAFVWTADSGMLDLDTLVVNAGSFRLGEASAINEVGQIAGWGYDSVTQELQAYLLTPIAAVPEPATLALFMLGAAGVAGAARRRGRGT